MKFKNKIYQSCERYLALHPRLSPSEELGAVVQNISTDEVSDMYGEGSLIRDFEKEVADLLGKEDAVIMPSGTMAQQIAMRIWSDQKVSKKIAFHPLCHLEIHEQHGYKYLHNLEAVLLGEKDRLFNISDLEHVNDKLAALLVELPQREIGGQLPQFEEMLEFRSWSADNGCAMHLDGARLWECAPYYNKSYSEICSLFDSIYVSFYKGLGGIAGAALVGDTRFIQEARVWQRRHGGNLIKLYPYVVSAREALKNRLHKMSEYHEKAKDMAAVINEIDCMFTKPKVPQTNMFHVYMKGDKEFIEKNALQIAKDEKVWLFSEVKQHGLCCSFELSIGDASIEISNDELREYLSKLIEIF